MYQDVWSAGVGEQLTCDREPGNRRDTFAVAIKKDDITVGHVPRSISPVCSVFLRRGGTISGRVTGHRRYSADLPQGGMEIPCTLTFQSGDVQYLDKIKNSLIQASAVWKEPQANPSAFITSSQLCCAEENVMVSQSPHPPPTMSQQARQSMTMSEHAQQSTAMSQQAQQSVTMPQYTQQSTTMSQQAQQSVTMSQHTQPSTAMSQQAQQSVTMPQHTQQSTTMSQQAQQSMTMSQHTQQSTAISQQAQQSMTMSQHTQPSTAMSQQAQQSMTMSQHAQPSTAISQQAQQSMTMSQHTQPSTAMFQQARQSITMSEYTQQSIAMSQQAQQSCHSMLTMSQPAQILTLSHPANSLIISQPIHSSPRMSQSAKPPSALSQSPIVTVSEVPTFGALLQEHSYAKSSVSHQNSKKAEDLKSKISKIDFESIIMGERLSDTEINIAQKMLKIQFPNVNGLNLTLCQTTDKKSELHITNWLQIIFCKDRSHWVAATTIGCEVGAVKVFDSIFHKLDEESKHCILNYLPKNTKIKLVGTSQKQIGDRDCGVFAIAFCTSLAFGKDPAKQKFIQERARPHLVTCFKNNKLSVFP